MIGMVNVIIQKTAKASAMVVHVDKIKMCKGKIPERGAFIDLFDDNGSARDAEIVNDIENNVEEEERKARPKRNAPMPARYVQQIYDVENYDVVECCRDNFQEVESFGVDEARPRADDIESGDGEEVDQVEVAGRAFVATHLHLQTPGETGWTIGQTIGALRGMGMNMVPRFREENLQETDADTTAPGMGFGCGPGPVGKPKGGSVKDKSEDKADVDKAGGQGPRLVRNDRAYPGKKGGGECYRHITFLGDMLPGQTFRMKRGMGGVTALTAAMTAESNENDANLADDVYSFIRRTPLFWTQARIMQVAPPEFRCR